MANEEKMSDDTSQIGVDLSNLHVGGGGGIDDGGSVKSDITSVSATGPNRSLAEWIFPRSRFADDIRYPKQIIPIIHHNHNQQRQQHQNKMLTNNKKLQSLIIHPTILHKLHKLIIIHQPHKLLIIIIHKIL